MTKENEDEKTKTPLSQSAVEGLVSTNYIMQVSAGDEWLYSNAYKTLEEARKEKTRMNAISGHARRIIKQTWSIVEC